MSITLYTSNTNGYDNERKDILCFTDYNRFIHPRLNAKIYKILYYQFVQTEWSVWIDSNIRLKVNASFLVKLAKNNDICVFKHPRRDCLYEEAEICKKKKLDYSSVIDSQILKYKNLNYPPNNGLAECSIIIRRDTKHIRDLCDNWWSEICTGSWRDQISFPFIFQNVNVRYLDPKIKDAIFFKKKHIKPRTIE